MNDQKDNNVTLSVLITGYDFDMSIFRRKRFNNLIFFLLGFIFGYLAIVIGYVLFLKMMKERKRLFKLKRDIDIKLTEAIGQIPIEEYLELKSRLIYAGRQ
jgi:hypothetical protein